MLPVFDVGIFLFCLAVAGIVLGAVAYFFFGE